VKLDNILKSGIIFIKKKKNVKRTLYYEISPVKFIYKKIYQNIFWWRFGHMFLLLHFTLIYKWIYRLNILVDMDSIHVVFIFVSLFDMSACVCMEYPITYVLFVQHLFVRNHIWNNVKSYMRYIYACKDPIHEDREIHF